MTRKTKPTTLLLTSGGIDSTACIDYFLSLGAEVRPLFIDFAQPALVAERKSATTICDYYGLKLRKIYISGIKAPLRGGELIGRNALFVMAALARARTDVNVISMGIHAGTPYFDCGPKFAKLCDELLTAYSDGRVRFNAPFLKFSKADVWQYCADKDVPVQLTWSCERSAKRPCGACASCRDRRELRAGA